MFGPVPFRSGLRSSRGRRAGSPGRPPRRIPLNAEQRLRRAHRHRLRALREFGLVVPASILDRHPNDLAWRVSVLDRWIARHLDLAGGRKLPPWTDEVDPVDADRTPEPNANDGDEDGGTLRPRGQT